jgi:hypothetical protein
MPLSTARSDVAAIQLIYNQHHTREQSLSDVAFPVVIAKTLFNDPEEAISFKASFAEIL